MKINILRKFILITNAILFISACSPSSSQVQTAIVTTDVTKAPIATTTHTATLTPTFTQTPTSTATPTLTPTSTATPTPTPIGNAYGIAFDLPSSVYSLEWPNLIGKRNIFAVNIDGTNLTPITNLDGVNFIWGGFSPDGQKILVRSESGRREDRYFKLYVMDSNGSNLIELTDNLFNGVSTGSWSNTPIWLSDGRIAYIAEELGQSYIFIVNRDGSGLSRLTKDDNNPVELLFADTTRIYWQAMVPYSGYWKSTGYFWTMLDGSDQQIITTWNEDNSENKTIEKHIREMVYSPANGLVAFHIQEDQVFFQEEPKEGQDFSWRYWLVANPDGTNAKRIELEGRFSFCAWSPDGQYFFLSGCVDDECTMIVNRLWSLSDSKLIELPDTQGSFPVWSPDGHLVLLGGCCGMSLELLNIETQEIIQIPTNSIVWDMVNSSYVVWIPAHK